jgi:hypothetical protein
MQTCRSTRVVIIVLLCALLGACAPQTGAPGGASLVTTADPSADWQARWEQTVQAAKREGKVVVVTHTNLYHREQIQKFNEKYPEIQVEHVPIRPSEFAPKVVTEQQNGIYGYDVWVSPTSNMVEVVLPTGGFELITPYLVLPEVTDASQWRGGAQLYASPDPYIILYQGRVDGPVTVNRDVLPRSDFNSIDHLLDPKVRGKIAIRTPSAPHQGVFQLAGYYRSKGEDFVTTLLTQQQPALVDNARLLTQNLIQGRYGVALGVDNETLDNCRREGGCRQIEEVCGCLYLLSYGMGVLKSPPNPNAAAVFTNWFLSKEGQETWVQTIASTATAREAHSARVDVEPHPDAIAQSNVPDYSNLAQYSFQGTQAGAADLQAVLGLYRRVEAGGVR